MGRWSRKPLMWRAAGMKRSRDCKGGSLWWWEEDGSDAGGLGHPCDLVHAVLQRSYLSSPWVLCPTLYLLQHSAPILLLLDAWLLLARISYFLLSPHTAICIPTDQFPLRLHYVIVYELANKLDSLKVWTMKSWGFCLFGFLISLSANMNVEFQIGLK